MKVLVAVDGSNASTRLAYSLRAFPHLNRIIVVHAISIPQLAYPGTGMAVGHEFSLRAEKAMRTEGNRILDEFIFNVPQEIGGIDKRIETGQPAEVILMMTEKEKVDLVMVGSRGLGMIRERALGSVSHRVTLHSPCPTLVVKSELKQIKHILLPLEHKADADQAIEFLSKNPFPKDVQITLLHVIPFMQPVLPIGALIPESVKRDLYAGAEKFLGDQSPRVTSLGYSVSPLVTSGAPSIVIHEQARKMNSDLIIMGVRSFSPLNRFLLGSVSHSVAHHSSCSVLVLK